MKNDLNLAAWSLTRKPLIYFFFVALTLAGILAYVSLGRREDPEYTIRQMVITTSWPGASARQVENQVTIPLEKSLQNLTDLYRITSYSLPNQSVITVEVKDTVSKDAMPEHWADARNIISAQLPSLPVGVETPVVNDHFDEVYGMIYALTGDAGYSAYDFKTTAEDLRQAILSLKGAGKVEFIGMPQEYVYVDARMGKLAQLSLSLDELKNSIQAANTVVDSGYSSSAKSNLPIRTRDQLRSLQDLSQLPIGVGNHQYRLADIADIQRSAPAEGECGFYYQGKPAIGIAVSMTSGENIMEFGAALSSLIANYQSELPAGMEIHQVQNQAEAVDASIYTFERSLLEALVIIFLVSFFALGKRAGIIVILCIPFVLAAVFSLMYYLKIDLHSVSLGGLIIALGLLVDDAMIVIEMFMVKTNLGLDKKTAAISAFKETSLPMLTGTLITCAAFIPVAFATGSASEVCASIFYVVSIALIISWLAAGLITPLLCCRLVNETGISAKDKTPAVKRFYEKYKQLLAWALSHRKKVLTATLCLFILSCLSFTALRQEFFPSSARPEIVMRLELPSDYSLNHTKTAAEMFSGALKNNDAVMADAKDFYYTTGGGMPRFVLSIDPAQDKPNMAEFTVIAKDIDARSRLEKILPQLARETLPEAAINTKIIITGSSVEYPIMFRVRGSDLQKVRDIARAVGAKMRECPEISDVRLTSGEKTLQVNLETDSQKLRQLGISPMDIGPVVQSAVAGSYVSSYYEGDNSLPILLRLKGNGGSSLDAITQVPIQLPSGKKVMLGEVAGINTVLDDAMRFRYQLTPCIQVCGLTAGEKSGEDIEQEIFTDLKDLRSNLPAGYSIELDGALADSSSNTEAFLKPVPLMVIIILVLLMLQVQDIKKALLIILTAPLGLIGVVFGLLITDMPMGFVVLMGITALFGIIIRNTVILIDQIDKHLQNGEEMISAAQNATISRFRPIMMTAMAAVLAMIPLAGNPFWGAMAVAMGSGLIVATVLTLIVAPVMYVSVFNNKKH